MATIHHLPTDIVCIILRYVAENSRAVAKPQEFTIPLLAVCRKWRSVVIPLFYSHAYFGEYGAYSSFTHCFTSRTNIDVILKNGYADTLRKFTYLSHMEIYAVDCLLSIARLLDISVDNCPELDSLMDYHGSNSGTPMDWNNTHHIAAITTIATTFASTFPNIRKLDIDIENAHGIINCFTSVLTDCFADQLVDFKYSGSLRFLNKRPLTGLQKVSLSLDGGDEEQIYPTIYPQSIQKLKLFIHGLSFNWKFFSTKHDFEDIVFDQLGYLHCLSDGRSEGVDGSNIDCVLRFPSIKKAIVQNFELSAYNIKRQLQSGLRELHYFDDLPMMLELSRLNLSSLSKLVLKLRTTPDIEEFVADTNTLFRRLNGIPSIRCSIHLDTNSTIVDNICWPNLTELVVHVGPTIDGVLRAALNMPDLIYLEISFIYFNQSVCDSMLEYFENFCRNHIEPSNSRIEVLKLRVCSQTYSDQLLPAMQVLKCRWPKLTKINVCV